MCRFYENIGQFVRKGQNYESNRDKDLEEKVVLRAVENNAKTSTRNLRISKDQSITNVKRILKSINSSHK